MCIRDRGYTEALLKEELKGDSRLYMDPVPACMCVAALLTENSGRQSHAEGTVGPSPAWLASRGLDRLESLAGASCAESTRQGLDSQELNA